MSWIMVDAEADGPIPGDCSMVSLAAVVIEPGLKRTFCGELKPISEKFVQEALAVSGFTREQTQVLPKTEAVMRSFDARIAEVGAGRPMFVSDNNGFNWLSHHFTGANSFGFSSTNKRCWQCAMSWG